ncbi:MAG: ATP-binding protein [bacterium]|nr:ATP-binding protein [bacterium]
MFPRWIDLSGNRSVLLLGPRRSGKTTLLKHRYPGYAYATLDDLDNLDWARSDPKEFIQSLGEKAIVDEIQRHPLLTVAVKYAIDEEHAHFFMTGSSSAGLLDASADSLAGRIDIRALPTACWGEDSGPPTHRVFEEQAPLKQLKQAQRQLGEARLFGQFPEVLMAAGEKDRTEILRNYRDTYFTRDLMMLSNLENLDGLRVLYHHLSQSIGSLLETSNLAREAGISFPTAKKYLNSLVQSQLVFKLTGYQYGPAKRYVKAGKIYLADIGIAAAFGTPLAIGQQLENFVIAELEKRRKLGFLEADCLHHYRSSAGREIDVIIDSGESTVAIEIKSTEVPRKRDLRNLEDFADTMNRPIRCILFYTGIEYKRIGKVELIPVAALYRGV